jgi:hypothetical protein
MFYVDIPEISLLVPSCKFGDDVKLEAYIDVNTSLFIWLKQTLPGGRFEIVKETRKPPFISMTYDTFDIEKISTDDEGQYLLVVSTKQAVGRRMFYLKAGK